MFLAASTPFWVPILTAIIGGLVTFGGIYLKYFLEKKKPKDNTAIREYIKIIHEVYGVLSQYLEELNASSIVIHKTENGGGVPKLGSQLFSSIIFESIDPPLKSTKDKWNRRPIDNAYLELLAKTLTDEILMIDTSEIQEGELKDFFDSEGILNSNLFSLASSEKCYTYCFINYTSPLINHNIPERKVILSDLRFKLNTLLEKSHQLSLQIEN